MFSHEQIVNFKNQVNKREFYRQFLELRQSGKLLWAVCPFHNDHSPSMSIDEDTGIFRCWSCGAHGDILDFYQRLKGKS